MAVSDMAGRAAGVAFSAVSRARGAKSLHPRGIVYEATVRVDGGSGAPRAARILAERAQHAGVIRFSRSVGLPKPLPDLFGISLRVTDAYGPERHQDLLAVTSVDAPVLHHVFVPVNDPQSAPYSSSLPYRAGAELFLIGMLPRSGSPRPEGRTLEDRLERAAATGKLRFDLAVAPLSGRFERVGEIAVGARLPESANAIRFNPFNTGGGLVPAGPFNNLRRQAYPASQAGWSA